MIKWFNIKEILLYIWLIWFKTIWTGFHKSVECMPVEPIVQSCPSKCCQEMLPTIFLLSHQILAEWLSASKNALFKQSLNPTIFLCLWGLRWFSQIIWVHLKCLFLMRNCTGHSQPWNVTGTVHIENGFTNHRSAFMLLQKGPLL